MVIQLTSEQEQRLQAIVESGAYTSPEEALEAALAAVELAVTVGFEGLEQELEGLLLDGLASETLSERRFWNSVDRTALELLAERKSGSRS